MTKVLASILCCFVSAACLAESKAEGPDLEATVRWMGSFLETHGALYDRRGAVFTNQIVGRRCQLDLVVKYQKPSGNEARSIASKLDLADFDPRVTIDSDANQNKYEVKLERSDAKMKTHEVTEYSNGQKIEMWTTEISLFFDSEASAQKFAKAMKHAIVLCGGKTAPF